MTNSDLLALAMPLIAVAAVGLVGAILVFQIKRQKRLDRTGPSLGVRGRLSEVEGGLFRFQPDSDAPPTGTFKKVVEKETAGH